MQGTAGCHLHTDGRTHPVSRVNHQVGACKWCTRVVQAPIPVVLQIVGVQLLNIHLRYKQLVYDQSGMNETTPVLCRKFTFYVEVGEGVSCDRWCRRLH